MPPRLVARRLNRHSGASKAGARECVLSREPLSVGHGSARRVRAVSSAGSRGPSRRLRVVPGANARRKRRQQLFLGKKWAVRGRIHRNPPARSDPGRKQVRSNRTSAGAGVRFDSEWTVDSRGVFIHLGFPLHGFLAVRLWNWRQRTGNTVRCRLRRRKFRDHGSNKQGLAV